MKKSIHKVHHFGLQEISLIALILLMAVSHTLYVLICRQYPVWDENQYMSLAIGFYDLFHKNIGTIWTQILTISDLRQPLYGFMLSVPLFIFGTAQSYKIALLMNGIFYLGSTVGIYLLTRQWCSKTASLLSAIIFAWYGNVLFYLHYTYSEMAATLWIVWATLYIVRSHFFTKRRETIIAGILTACAALTRWIALPFLIGPLAVCGIGALVEWWKYKKLRRTIMYHLLYFFVLGVLLPFFLYYLPNIKPFGDYVWRNRYYAPEWVAQFKDASMANPFSIRSLMFYFNIISQNTVFLLLPFLIGICFAIIHPKKYFYPLITFICGYGFLTIFAIWKEDRFIVPLYPVMASLSVIFFDSFRKKWMKTVCVFYLVGVSMMSFYGASWAYGPMGSRGLKDIVLPSFITHPRRIYLTPIVWPPNQEYVNVHEVIDAISADKKAPEKQKLVKTFTYDPVDNALNAIILYEKRDLVSLTTVATSSSLMTNDLWTSIGDANYVLTKTDPIPTPYNDTYVFMRSIFVPIDNSTLYLYSNKKNQ